jgi:glycosyltransferase involved in cell wall biosynthesis
MKRQVHFVANCVYCELLAGGDIHFLNMARATVEAGFPLNFFGGHALKQHVVNRNIPATVTLTDHGKLRPINIDRLEEQLRLLVNYFGRFMRTLRKRGKIQTEDIPYAVTDYWFDTLPVMLSRAKRKMMVLGMDAPTLKEVILRTRPDVAASRLNSVYYWLSQNLSVRLFRFCKTKRLFYVHPVMKPRLLGMGYRESEIVFISNGFDMGTADQVPEQPKEFDVVWIGRWHRQKGIDDLLATLQFLAQRVKDFRAVVIGKMERELRPLLEKMGIAQNVEFAGLVSEYEKFRLFKASRLFLMPSTYESWGIVIGEALCSRVPVVAYDLAAYRPIFGDLVNYVPSFDRDTFQRTALSVLEEARAGKVSLNEYALKQLRAEHSWEAARARFAKTLRELSDAKL